MVLPKFLSSSYERYKQDTTLFTTWLAQAAAACGYKPTGSILQEESPPVQPVQNEAVQPSSSRLKGKERKAAKEAAEKAERTNGLASDADRAPEPAVRRYTITTKELLAQAQSVANSIKPSITLPAGLRSIVERTIRARQRCAAWFQQSKVQNKYSDQGHLHFIKVLEQALELLDPCSFASTSLSQEGSATTDKVDVSTSLGDLANRFGLLDVEETPRVDDPVDVAEIVDSVSIPKKSKKSKGKPIVESYELEDDEEDLAFVIFCFFEDLHRIQDYVKGLWKDFQAGEVSVEAAAVTTNAALELVRRAEEKILAINPSVFNRKRSWDTIAIIIFYADAFEKGVCPETRLKTNDTLRITEFDDFIYLSTARILMKFTYIAGLPTEASLQYPLLCLPLRAGYISRPELLGTAQMNKKEDEDRILSQFIIDQHLWSTIKEFSAKASDTHPPPMEDEFSKVLENFQKEGILSVSLVFASQVFLDIREILGSDVDKGYQELRKTATEIDKIMNLKDVSAGVWDVGGSGERWHESDMHIPLRIKTTSLYWIFENPFPKVKETMLSEASNEQDDLLDVSSYSTSELARESDGRPRAAGGSATTQSLLHPQTNQQLASSREKPKPPRDPKFNTISTKLHQIPGAFQGSRQDFQRLTRQYLIDSGEISKDDTVSPEHRENAKRLSIKRIQPSKDLDFIFTSNPILCGLLAFNLITDCEAAGIALCNWHKTAWPIAHLYHALRQMSLVSRIWPEMDDLIAFHKGDLFSGQLPSSPSEFFSRFALSLGVSPTMFARNSRNRSDDLRLRKGTSGTKLKTTAASDIFRSYFDKKDSMEGCMIRLEDMVQKAERNLKGRANKRSLTDLQFLEKLNVWLSGELPSVRFDYITLTKQCTRVLKDIRQRIALELGIQNPIQQTQDSADQTLPITILQILEEVKRDNPLIRGGQLITPPSPQLRVASEAMQNFLKTYRPGDIVSNFNGLPRNPRAPSGRVPNHWNISIRHVSMSPPGDLVFFVQPDSHYAHTEGPIQTAEGHVRGHTLNPKSLATLQVIARLMMKAFVEGMGVPDARGQQRPWSWSTNDPDFARRITKVMRDMGVQEEGLLSMPVADAEEIASSDDDWKGFADTLMGLSNRSNR